MKSNLSKLFRRIFSILGGVMIIILLNNEIDNSFQTTKHIGKTANLQNAETDPLPIPPRP